MKFYIGIIIGFFFVSCGDSKVEKSQKELEENKRIESLIFKSDYARIGDIEIMSEDLGKMNWQDANEACKNLGNNWRLPTKEELNILFLNRDFIGDFAKFNYWCSSEYDELSSWYQHLEYGIQMYSLKDSEYLVRAIRTIK